MKLDGVHHVTAITGDAPRNVDFYVRVMGLRLVKKTVNQDDPTVYHLFYADQNASPGADLTFFEYPGAPRGQVGAGMVERVVFRVASQDSFAFWAERLRGEGIEAEETPDGLRFADFEGLGLELVVEDVPDPPLRDRSPDIPEEHALSGFAGVRVLTAGVGLDQALLEQQLEFEPRGENAFEARGDERGGFIEYRQSDERGRGGAGTVHHVAWASKDDEHEAWQRRLAEAGAPVTPVIDRFYFRSIYFRIPSGVLFEIATHSPGFTVDEPLDELGKHLSLPPKFEKLREQLGQVLTPLPT